MRRRQQLAGSRFWAGTWMWATTLTLAAAIAAQPTGREGPGVSPSRAALESAAAAADQVAASSSNPAALRDAKKQEAAAIRERLRDGDFQVGDRIELEVAGNKDLTQAFQVREGRVLELPNLPPISVQGVLHSELQPYLAKELGRYLRDAQVLVRSPVRLAVLGQIARPGFYAIPSDALVSDAMMTAGGPTQTADITQTIVRRGGETLYSKEALHRAVSAGATLDQLNLRAGDEIVVGEKSHRNFGTILGGVAGVAGVAATIVLLTRH